MRVGKEQNQVVFDRPDNGYRSTSLVPDYSTGIANTVGAARRVDNQSLYISTGKREVAYMTDEEYVEYAAKHGNKDLLTAGAFVAMAFFTHMVPPVCAAFAAAAFSKYNSARVSYNRSKEHATLARVTTHSRQGRR